MLPGTSTESLNIRPGVSILAVLRHLNYRPWFALAEFVDNSIQSYLDHRTQLEAVEGPHFKLRVTIELNLSDEGRIVIRDNAAGIDRGEYPRAFRPAALPPDNSGLSEFGMGMKSAACWFAEKWSVRTSALGEPMERVVNFDIQRIVRDSLEELQVLPTPAAANDHYTEITMSHLYKPPQTRTIAKMREHLASIYRVFIRDGILVLRFDNDVLSYPEPKILKVPHYKNSDSPAVNWRKDIDFDFGLGMRAYGFAALRETGSTSGAGFALFRRRRLIQGSADEGYRPEAIFGKSNSFAYQRLFGELELEGFEVSHTKDGFRWDENEEPFLDLLKQHINDDSLPLLDQAEGYRARPKTEDLKKGADAATQRTATVIQNEVAPVLEQQLETPAENAAPPPALPPTPRVSQRTITVVVDDENWEISLELSNDPAVGEWLAIFDKPRDSTRDAHHPRHLGIRVSLAHPFMQRFGGTESSQIEPTLRVAAALALAEVTARAGGLKEAGTVRRNLNDLLRHAFSKP